jgi:hypothetical protein
LKRSESDALCVIYMSVLLIIREVLSCQDNRERIREDVKIQTYSTIIFSVVLYTKGGP